MNRIKALTVAITVMSLVGMYQVPAASAAMIPVCSYTGTSWGSTGSGNGQFNYLTNVSVSDDGQSVYTSELSGQRVQKFDSNGGYLSQWNSSPNGLLGTTWGVDAKDGYVYVGDWSNGPRMQAFDVSGGYLGVQILGFSGLSGKSATDAAGNVYTIGGYDGTTFVMREYTADLSAEVKHFAVGYVPDAIAVDAAGNVYVAVQGGTIEKYDSAGVRVATWSTGGNVQGLTIDSNGNIFAANQVYNSVQMYTTGGASLGSLYAPGAIGVDIDSNGNLYVADINANMVRKAHCDYVDALPPTLSLSGNQTSAGISMVSWSTTDATACTATGGDAYWPGTRSTAGSYSTQPLTAVTTFSMTCTGPGGSVTKSIALLPNITQCSLDALAAIGKSPADFPPSAMNGLENACKGNGNAKETTIPQNGISNGSVKIDLGDVLVVGNGATTNGTSMDVVDGDNTSVLIIGSNVTMHGSVKGVGIVVVAGTGSTITGSLTGIGTLYYLPGTSLNVGGQVSAGSTVYLP